MEGNEPDEIANDLVRAMAELDLKENKIGELQAEIARLEADKKDMYEAHSIKCDQHEDDLAEANTEIARQDATQVEMDKAQTILHDKNIELRIENERLDAGWNEANMKQLETNIEISRQDAVIKRLADWSLMGVVMGDGIAKRVTKNLLIDRDARIQYAQDNKSKTGG